MVFNYCALFIIMLYVICDFNYVIRTLFTVWCGRLWRKTERNLSDVTSIYGMCTFQDCDIWFEHLRLSRLIRDLDFARYHYYDQMGIYERSQKLNIRSLQGSTLTHTYSHIPLFTPYKINTKLIYWDNRSLFFEHEVVTLRDGKLCHLLVSRQYAIGKDKESTADLLLDGLPGSQDKPDCPAYIQKWLKSQQQSSVKLRAM